MDKGGSSLAILPMFNNIKLQKAIKQTKQPTKIMEIIHEHGKNNQDKTFSVESITGLSMSLPAK